MERCRSGLTGSLGKRVSGSNWTKGSNPFLSAIFFLDYFTSTTITVLSSFLVEISINLLATF